MRVASSNIHLIQDGPTQLRVGVEGGPGAIMEEEEEACPETKVGRQFILFPKLGKLLRRILKAHQGSVGKSTIIN